MTPENNTDTTPTPEAKLNPEVIPVVAPVPAPEPPAFVAPETPPAVPVAESPEPETSAVIVSADDKVWISKDEYKRLQQTAAPVVAGGVSKPVRLFSNLQIATTAIAAISVVIGLLTGTDGGMGYMLVIGVVILLINGIFTLTDYLASKKPGQVIRTHKGRNIALFVVALVLIASPALAIGAMILFFIILCGTGGCNGT